MRIALTLALLMLAHTAQAVDVSQKARALADKALVVDTHIDVPYRLENNPADVSEATAGGDFDYPRAQAGGLDVAFMSIYIPADKQDSDAAKELADKMIKGIEKLAQRAPQKFALVHSANEASKLAGTARVGFALGMENGGPVQSLADLQHYHERGIRYITLTHSKANHISDSSYDLEHRWHGLSPFGKKLVPAMNRTGVLVDISHVSDEAFWQALQLSEVPLIASHSSARHFTPGFERNLSDDMIRAMAEKGGVVQINFGSTFVTQRANAYYAEFKTYRDEWLTSQGLEDDESAADAFYAGYRAAHPFPYATLDDVLDHVDHVVKVAGIDHVGIGSDYDGVGDSLPVGLKTVADYPVLVQGLLNRGYSESDIRKVLGGNFMRVWREAESYAERN